MKKQLQQWTMFFKLFSQTPPLFKSSSSSSPSSSYIARSRQCHRLFCSATTTTTTTTTDTTLFAAEHSLKKKKLPLLIVPYDHKIGDADGFSVCDGTLGLISLFEKDKKNKSEEEVLHLPEIANRRICGSSEGWLVTVHENGEIQLLNPFSRVLVHLPPLTSFPEVISKLASGKENEDFFYFVNEDISGFFKLNLDFPGVDSSSSSHHHPVFKGYESHLLRERFFQKVVTNTTTTTTTTQLLVMAIYGVETRRLAFCRPSDKRKRRWMGCLQGDGGFYDDVTFYKGNFYAVDSFGDVVVVKGLLDGPSPPFVETIIEGGEDRRQYKKYLVESYSSSSSSSTDGGCGDGLESEKVFLEAVENKPSYKNYLVESYSSSSSTDGGCGGDLLKVRRCVETKYKESDALYRPMGFNTIGFRVMKLDFNGGPASLVEVTNLGEDCALFIGYNHSFSFSASEFPGCKGNCIYFTDNNLSQFYKFGGHDMGVYNLEDGSFERLNYETTSSSSQIFMPPPLWYVPN